MTATMSFHGPAGPPDLLDLYLAQVSQCPTLSKQEVSALARRVRAGQRAAPPPPASARRRGHHERLAADGRAAADALVEANLRLVVAMTRRYHHSGLGLLDLVQEGNLGLLRAVARFDPEKGFAFSTYAAWWIRAAMAEAVARSNGSAGSRSDRRRGRSTVGDVRLVPLSEAAGRKGRGLAEVLPDPATPSPADHAVAISLAPAVVRLLEVLDQRERKVLCWHFGLDRRPPRTLADIAGTLGLSEERVRQIEAVALAKLRRPGRRREAALDLLVG